ncbi:hypothetical protein AB0392_33685 [Nonomuraea angiospora]|uniref:hypothetical protein n=1 Tax=Nonomuraea angiospora TaxID=46172 RepID=UPI0034500E59
MALGFTVNNLGACLVLLATAPVAALAASVSALHGPPAIGVLIAGAAMGMAHRWVAGRRGMGCHRGGRVHGVLLHDLGNRGGQACDHDNAVCRRSARLVGSR